MQEGPMDYFECIDFGGTQIKVQLGRIDTSATDPSWIISPGPNKLTLEYLNANRDRYQAKCHCQVSAGSQMHVWIETEHNGATRDVPGLLIQDWAGNQWTVDVDSPNVGGGSAQVKFHVTRGVMPHH